MDRNENIRKLEERRLIANKKIDRLNRKVKEVEQEQRDIDLELDRLKQHPLLATLADIPAVPWEILLKNFVIPKSVLSNLHLASPTLEEKFSRKIRKSRMDFVGEAAFSLLVQNVYLDAIALRNCTRSKSDELGMLAALSWCYLDNPNFRKTRFPDIQAMTQFSEMANKKRRLKKVWEPFIGKVFSFDCRKLEADKEVYWRGAKAFLKNYGKYISTIEVYSRSENRNLDLVDDEFLTLAPNLQYLHVLTQSDDGKWNRQTHFGLASKMNFKKCEREICLKRMADTDQYKFFESISEIVTETNFDLRQSVYTEQIRKVSTFKNLKQLALNATRGTGGFSKYLRDNLRNVESIYLNSTLSMGETFKLLLPFSSLSSVTLRHKPGTIHADRMQMYYRISGHEQFPTVKSFFYYMVDDNMKKYLTAGTILQIFPNLKYLEINSPIFSKKQLKQRLKSQIRPPAAAPRTDLFKLYRKDTSLKHSNIWSVCNSLRVLRFKTQMKSKWINCLRVWETYSRNADGLIMFEKRFVNIGIDYRMRCTSA